MYDVVPVEEEEDIYGDDSIYAAIVTYQRVVSVCVCVCECVCVCV